MKAKVIIENGDATIILTPENEFEKDIIDKRFVSLFRIILNYPINVGVWNYPVSLCELKTIRE